MALERACAARMALCARSSGPCFPAPKEDGEARPRRSSPATINVAMKDVHAREVDLAVGAPEEGSLRGPGPCPWHAS